MSVATDFGAYHNVLNSEAAGFITNESSKFLLVTVHNIIHPITEYVLHLVFDPYGYVEIIDILQSSELVQAIVRFDSCPNASWAKSQLQERYIYDRCCQLDIQFYKKTDYEDKTENLLMENEFASDRNFIRNKLNEMMTVIERMQDRIKSRNSSIQKNSHTTSYSSLSTRPKLELDIMKLKSSIRSSSIPMSSSIVVPAPCPVVSLSIAPSKLELNIHPHLKLLERPPFVFTAATEVCFPATLYAATLSHLLLSTSIKVAPAKEFPLMIECALLRYELNEYKMFDLMLEQNGRKTCERKVFIFDPGGNLTIAAKLFDEIFKGIFDGKYHNHLYMTLDTFKRVEWTKRSAGQVVYQILLQAALIQPVLHISMLKLCPNLHEATSLPSASTISIASSKLELNHPSYLTLLERSPSIFTAPAEVSFSATSNATSLSHLVPSTPMELAPAKESSSMIECVPLQIIPLSHSHFISGSCLTGNILCLERKVLIFDPGGNFKLGCSFAVRMIQGDAKLTHNSNSITCYCCHQRPTLRTRSFSRGR